MSVPERDPESLHVRYEVAYVPYDEYGYAQEQFDPWRGFAMCGFASRPDINGRISVYETEC